MHHASCLGACDRATCRDRVIIIDYSVVICPVPAVSLASHCERCCSGDRRFTRGAVGRSSGRRNRTSIASSRDSRPTVRRSLISFVRGPGRTRTPIASRLRLKVGCITFLPRARRAAGGRAFELRHRLHRVSFSWERSESNRDGAKHAWVTATPGATPVCAPLARKREEPPRIFSRAAPDPFRLLMPSYESGAFPS